MLQHLRPLIEQAGVRRYASGSTIYFQGEAPKFASVLARGVVRIYSISAQGDEQILLYHVAGEFFPSSWIFGKSPSTMFFYEAVTECEIAMIPRKVLMDYMLATTERMQVLIDYLTTDYAASMIRINGLEQPKARKKLLFTLYYLCKRYGDTDTPLVNIPLVLTHKSLANLVGLTRETASSELSKLKREGLLTYDNQKYVIDIDKLMDAIGEDSWRGISLSV